MQLALTLAALMVLQQQPQAQQSTASVEGTITRAGSALPIEGALVQIFGDKGANFIATSDANGHYVIPGIPEGVYAVAASADGYLSEPRTFSTTAARLTLADKQRSRYDVSMTPVGAIRGRILDDNREPLEGITVELLRLGRDTQGRPVWGTLSVFTTNKQGDYRFDELSPEEYYIRASRKPAGDNFRSRVDVAATYFPGTSDARSASAIRLSGADDMAADFSLANMRTYAVEGKVSRPDQKNIDDKMQLYAIPQDPRVPLDDLFAAGVEVRSTADGKWDFELHGLLPGVYDLFAVTQTSSSGTQTTTKDANGVWHVQYTLDEIRRGRIAATTIQIRDEDIKGLQLSLEPGTDVKGRVEVIDNAGKPLPFEIKRFEPNPTETEATHPQLLLWLEHKQQLVSSSLNLEPAQKEFPEPNEFVIDAVPAGTYNVRVHALGVPAGFYVADIRAGAGSILDEGLTVSAAGAGPLEVIVGLDGGTISGTITGGKNLPVIVVLAPVSSPRQNPALFKTAVLENATDLFEITGVAPGGYSLFAFEVSSIEDIVPFGSADFLARYQARTTPVTARRSATAGPVRVQMISRDQWNP